MAIRKVVVEFGLVAGRVACLKWEVEWFDGRGWGISAALDAWDERLSFLVV